jgi:uncharacterized protein
MKTPVLIFSLLLSFLISFGNEVPERPKPLALVNDLAGLLSTAEKAQLEKILSNYLDSTSTEIVIVIQKNISNADIIEHSNLIIKEWGIGGMKNDNGVIITYSMEDHKIGVVAGYGVGNFVDEAAAYRIRENLLKPKFREGKYYEGFKAASTAVMKLISGNYETHDVKSDSQNAYVSIVIFLVVFFIFFVILPAWRYRTIRKAHIGGNMNLLTIFLLMNNLGGSNGKSFGDFSKGKGSFQHQLSVTTDNGGGGSSGSW